jgi:hypothetical protein
MKNETAALISFGELQSFFAGTDTSFSVATAVESCAITEINAKVRFRESEVEAAN